MWSCLLADLFMVLWLSLSLLLLLRDLRRPLREETDYSYLKASGTSKPPADRSVSLLLQLLWQDTKHVGQPTGRLLNKGMCVTPKLRQKKTTETVHLRSGNFLLDFLDAEDLHGEGVTSSVM